MLDRKTGVAAYAGSNTYISWKADVATLTDYYPFGMPMPGRSWESGMGSKFGFNGQQKDDEIAGKGNSLEFGARMLDVRLGRWKSIDPLEAKYPFASPYNFVLNTPNQAKDPDGRDVELIIGKPYTDAKGEYHQYGHAAIRVFNAAEGYDMVYDFGRYGKVDWNQTTGEGIMNVYSDGKSYLKSEMGIRSSVGYSATTSVADDRAVMDYFKQQTDAGKVYNGGAVPGGGGTAYKLDKSYDIFDNNCLTKSCGGLNQIGLNWLGSEYEPNKALSKMEGRYKDIGLSRTEYNKGGEIKLTYTSPGLNKPNFNKPIQFSRPKSDVDNTGHAPAQIPNRK